MPHTGGQAVKNSNDKSRLRRMRGRREFAGLRHARGAGLIEALIAIIVLAFGVLGIAALQMTALRNSQSSLERSQATIAAYAILDAMRANREEAIIGRYNLTTMTCSPPDRGTLAMNDLADWIASLKGTVGSSACATVVCGSVECEVTVQWDDTRANGDPAQRITTVTRL